MEDLALSAELGRLVLTMLDDDKVVAVVCHGPAALLSATRPDGTWAFAGRKLAGITNDEETQAGLADNAPWLLEDRMREAGREMQSGPAWQPFSVVYNNVVTGQNPASSSEVAHKTVEGLDARAHWIHVVPYEGAWTFKQNTASRKARSAPRNRRSRPPRSMPARTATGNWSSMAAADASARRSPFIDHHIRNGRCGDVPRLPWALRGAVARHEPR
jgi:hypothetical protein